MAHIDGDTMSRKGFGLHVVYARVQLRRSADAPHSKFHTLCVVPAFVFVPFQCLHMLLTLGGFVGG